MVNGIVTDADGKKMSKSRGNIVEPFGVIERHGVDAVRLFLVSSSKVWEERRFDEAVIRQGAGRFLRTLKNIYSGMFANYANFGWSPSDVDPAPVDRPVITETTALGAAYLAGLQAGLCPAPEEFAASWALDQRFEPAMGLGERDAKYARWRRAVEATMMF